MAENTKTENPIEYLWGKLGNWVTGVALSASIWIASLFLSGYVLTVLWPWYVTPLFPTMPTLDHLQATGLVLILAMLTKQAKATPVKNKDESTEEKGERFLWDLAAPFVRPLMFLLVGWAIHAIWF